MQNSWRVTQISDNKVVGEVLEAIIEENVDELLSALPLNKVENNLQTIRLVSEMEFSSSSWSNKWKAREMQSQPTQGPLITTRKAFSVLFSLPRLIMRTISSTAMLQERGQLQMPRYTTQVTS